MLIEILIKNLLLIEEAHLSLEPGFTVISGETGSGKTALVIALNLLFGDKWDTSLLRNDNAEICATFSPISPQVKCLLEEAGIPAEEELIIERHLQKSGRSKAFLNQKQVHISFLKAIKEHLIEIVDQQSSLSLFDEKNHLEMLDLFGDSKGQREKVSLLWQTLAAKKRELSLLQNSLEQREKEKQRLLQEVSEIQEVKFQEGEDELLFQEYTQLAHVEERGALAKTLSKTLGESLSLLQGQARTLEKLTSYDTALEETKQCYQSALLELQEVGYTLDQMRSRLQHQPQRLEEIQTRLSSIERLKKRYGEDLLGYATSLEKRLLEIDEEKESTKALQEEITNLENECNEEFTLLSTMRSLSSPLLEKACMAELKGLNLPQVAFQVQKKPTPRSSSGDEAISFWLAPNKGEKFLSVKDSLSGGERNRLLLALKSALAHKEQIPVLLFDEIDANIGGITATQVGQKLKTMSQNTQILSITHFPQVASFADHHFTISKKEINQRTLTEVKPAENKEKELLRMAGK